MPDPASPEVLGASSGSTSSSGGVARVALGTDELARVRQQVLFIWGDNDMFAGPEYGRRACAVSPTPAWRC